MAMPTLPDGALGPRRTPWRATLLFAGLAGIVVALLGLFSSLTRERVERNENAWLAPRLGALLAGVDYDNDPLTDAMAIDGNTGIPAVVYRARTAGQPVAAVLLVQAPDGYGGPLELLVAIDASGTVRGVDVVRHTETPGIGDVYAIPDSPWQVALRNRPAAQWSLRREGGDFDAISGATITASAIIKAVRRTVDYYLANREQLFAQAESP